MTFNSCMQGQVLWMLPSLPRSRGRLKSSSSDWRRLVRMFRNNLGSTKWHDVGQPWVSHVCQLKTKTCSRVDALKLDWIWSFEGNFCVLSLWSFGGFFKNVKVPIAEHDSTDKEKSHRYNQPLFSGQLAIKQLLQVWERCFLCMFVHELCVCAFPASSHKFKETVLLSHSELCPVFHDFLSVLVTELGASQLCYHTLQTKQLGCLSERLCSNKYVAQLQVGNGCF